MGYTHYWTVKRTIQPGVFGEVAEDVKALAAAFNASGQRLSEQDGPIFSTEEIIFNGKEPDDYETFVLTPKASDFEFCKTQFRPYDALVCAALIAAKHHIRDGISVRSDGEWSEWDDGRDLYRQVFPDRDVTSVLDSDDE